MTTLRDYQQKNAVLFKTHFVRGFVTHISVGIYLQQENTLLIPFRMSNLDFKINVHYLTYTNAQFPKINVIPLVNKPYGNEVTLNGQNPPLKYCSLLYFLYAF